MKNKLVEFLLVLSMLILVPSLAVAETQAVPDLKLGLANQPVNDVILKENVAGSIKAYPETSITDATNGTAHKLDAVKGYIKLTLPAGVDFSTTPSASVATGDLQIDPGSVTTGTDPDGTHFCLIGIKSTSTIPSTIKISNLKITVDRTVPVGPVFLSVKGSAINETGNLFSGDTITKVLLGNIVVPSAGASAVFNIGSNIYSVNGVSQAMDSEPYVENNRTYIPVRYLAGVLGVDNKDITYDGSRVILKKGSTELELVVGSNLATVNGLTTQMDVTPKITNGRTMLSARFIAEMFGAKVSYADNKVIINLN